MERQNSPKTKMCSAKDKQVASKMLRGNILRNYGLLKAANGEFGFTAKARRANGNRPTSLQYSRKKQCNIISTATEEKITRLYEPDVNSRATTVTP